MRVPKLDLSDLYISVLVAIEGSAVGAGFIVKCLFMQRCVH